MTSLGRDTFLFCTLPISCGWLGCPFSFCFCYVVFPLRVKSCPLKWYFVVVLYLSAICTGSQRFDIFNHPQTQKITDICTLIVGDFMFSAPTKPTITCFRPPVVKSVHNCQRFHVFSLTTHHSPVTSTSWEILQKNLWLETSLVAGAFPFEWSPFQ